MHLYILTRGIKHEVDRMINDLQAQYLPFEFKGTTNFVQLAVRPIQLWEIVMPEPQLQVVMNTISTAYGEAPSWKNPQLAILRKALRAKKLPEQDLSVGKRLVYNHNVGVYPIGIKPDKFNEDGEQL